MFSIESIISGLSSSKPPKSGKSGSKSPQAEAAFVPRAGGMSGCATSTGTKPPTWASPSVPPPYPRPGSRWHRELCRPPDRSQTPGTAGPGHGKATGPTCGTSPAVRRGDTIPCQEWSVEGGRGHLGGTRGGGSRGVTPRGAPRCWAPAGIAGIRKHNKKREGEGAQTMPFPIVLFFGSF